MNIRFKTIGLENFLSFGEYQEVDLSDRGYVLIQGVNKNPADNSSSNGAGKTSLIDAIMYALTGTTTRGINKDLTNMYTEGGMMVKLDFDVDGKSYTIIRSKDHYKYGSTILFYVDGEDKSGRNITSTRQIIKDYLPELTESLITSVVILGQGMPNRFTNNSPSGRKEVLEKLSKSDFMIDDIKEKVSARKTSLSDEINKLKNEQSGINGQLKVYNEQLENYNKQLSSLTAVEQWEVEEEQEELVILQNELNDLTAQQNHILEDIDKINQELIKNSESKNDSLSKLNDKYSSKIQFFKDEKTRLNLQMGELSKKIKECNSATGICPTCKQPLIGFKKIDTAQMEADLKDLKVQFDDASAKYDDSNIEYTKEKTQVEGESSSNAKDLNIRINKLRNEDLKTINDYIKENKNKTDEQTKRVNNLIYNYNNYNRLKEELEENIKKAQEKINEANEVYNANNDKQTELEDRIDIVNKINAITTRNFRGYLLTNVIQYLNIRAKDYCPEMFGDSEVKFVLDDNNLDVYYNGKVYENLSGGEKKKVDIICQLAIRDMLCQYSNFNSNILVLDEFTDSLDAQSTEAVINCISNKLNYIESIFIITHATNFPIPNDSVITVEKGKDGISRII